MQGFGWSSFSPSMKNLKDKIDKNKSDISNIMSLGITSSTISNLENKISSLESKVSYLKSDVSSLKSHSH